MTEREFCYWLQGFFEINGGEQVVLTPAQAQVIADHLALVFQKVTPERSQPQRAPSPRDVFDGLRTMRPTPGLPMTTIC